MNGLFLARPEGLWALAAALAAAGLYLFHRRFRPKTVTGLFLWGDPKRNRLGGGKVEKPHLGRAFWFDVLAAALLALALSGPGWRGGGDGRKVVVLDDCFAMHARGGVDRAREFAAGGAPVVLAGDHPTRLRGDAAEWVPRSVRGGLDEALALVRDLYGSGLEIHVVTNQSVDPPAPGPGNALVLHVLPGRGDNLAFGPAWRRGDGAADAVIATITNHGRADRAADVALLLPDGGRLAAASLTVAAGSARTVELSAAGANGETVEAVLSCEGEDVIAEDDRVLLPPAPGRTVRYFLAGDAKAFRLALEAAGAVPAAEEEADIVIAAAPRTRGAALAILVPEEREPGLVLPPYIVDGAQPLCRDADLAGIPWAAARTKDFPSLRETYIFAGALPLFALTADGSLYLNVLPGVGPLANSPAWPVLFSNIVALAREKKGGAATSFAGFGNGSDAAGLAAEAATRRVDGGGKDAASGTTDLGWPALAAAVLLAACNWRAERKAGT